MSFSNGQDAKEIAARYINEHHPHLANVLIEYQFTSKTIKHKGKVVLAETKLISGLPAYLITRDLEEPKEQLFAITFSQSDWALLAERPDARAAIVDHELAHCDRDEDGNLSLNPHDIEEFNAIVERHGAWKDDIARFIKAAKAAKTSQMPFDFSLARENQERDAVGRDDLDAERGLDEERAAVSTKVTVIKGKKSKGEEQRQAASGE